MPNTRVRVKSAAVGGVVAAVLFYGTMRLLAVYAALTGQAESYNKVYGALGMLPVQLIGIVLLVASVVFFILELQHPGFGVPAAGGVICLLLGGWFLFEDAAQVSLLVLVPVAAGATAFFLVVLRAAIRMRRSTVEMRDDTMVGREGIVVRDLDPVGVVQVASEEWTAESTGPSLVRGTRVRILEMQKLKLTVEPLDAAGAAAGDAEGRQS